MKIYRAALLAAVLIVTLTGFGKLGLQFARLGGPGKSAVKVIQPNGDILLVDGVSFILQTDAASLICRAGGC